MRVPLDWLKEYVDVSKLSTKEIGDAFTQLGLMTDKPFDGKVFDLEHRFDRSDWLSILGCARDLAAYLKVDLKLPPTYTQEGKKPQDNQLVDIKIECPDTVNRFNTRVFRGVTVKASPEWLKSRLEDYGIPSINNIVDVTNYVMVELGQPMHAQDLSKFRKREIVIRKAHNEEKLCTFLGDEVTLYPEAFVLTQDGTATVLGGIVGGRETGVDGKTTDIILDAGNYNQNIIRKVSRKLKIQNETVLRYDKLLHPNLTQYAIDRATYLILELAGGEYYQNVDWNPKKHDAKKMVLRKARIGKLAGFEISDSVIADILKKLDYTLESRSDDTYKVVVPYFRTDVEVEDDIVSDILRINGYINIPTAQIQSAPPKDITPEIYKFEETLRDALVQLGGHECITDPLVSRNGSTAGDQIVLENSQNSQKNALRTCIAGTLAEMVTNYSKNKINSTILFEIGKIYTQKGDKKNFETYLETRVLECFVFDENKKPKDTHQKTSSLLGAVFKNLGINYFAYKNIDEREASIVVGDMTAGSVRYNGFTLLTEILMSSPRHIDRVIAETISTNSVETSLIVPKDVPVGDVTALIKSENSDITKVEFLEEYLGAEVGKDKRSILIKTYFKPEIKPDSAAKIMEAVALKLTGTFNVHVRS
jgi:phenylalanyl-tRNA synthetase beta chain